MVQVSHVLARLKREPIADLPIAAELEQLLHEKGHLWRDRMLTPLVTVRLFLLQILGGNVSIAALRQRSGLSFSPSSYSAARARLPLEALQFLLQFLHEQALRSLNLVKQIGPRIFIADGSTFSTQDTEDLNKHFELPKGTTPGVGYPMGKLMGLLDAATGMFVSLLALPLFQHDMRGVLNLHPMLSAGDILLACREPVERETGRFAAFAILHCSMPRECLPASACISAARKRQAEPIAGASPRRCPNGWTRRPSP